MKIEDFALERFFARHEFSARYLLSCSDCQPLRLDDLLAMADEEGRELWSDLSLGYTETQGHLRLRQAVADRYDWLSADDIQILAPGEGIFLVMHALLEPGDHVVCTMPAYQSLHQVARSIGCEVTAWAAEEPVGWRFEVAGLQAALRPDTRLLVVNFPHNPTGAVPTESEWTEIHDLARNHGISVLSDEMYRGLEVEPGSTLKPAASVSDIAVSLDGLSKTLGLPGLRIGWLATRNRDLLESIVRIRDYSTICSSAPSEILGVIALANRERILCEQTRRVRRNVELLDRFIGDHPEDLQWFRPRGGSVAFARLLRSEGAEAFCRRLVETAGIMLVPSTLFRWGDRHVRLGCGREDLPEVLEFFGAFLDH